MFDFCEIAQMELVDEQRRLAVKLLDVIGVRSVAITARGSVNQTANPVVAPHVAPLVAPHVAPLAAPLVAPLAAIDSCAAEITGFKDEVARLFRGKRANEFGADVFARAKPSLLGNRRWKPSRLDGRKRPHRTLLRFVLRETGHPCTRVIYVIYG
jgi:hypothetical protein